MINYISRTYDILSARLARRLQTPARKPEQPKEYNVYSQQQLRNKCQNALAPSCQRPQEKTYPQSIYTDVIDLALQGKSQRAVVLFREKHHLGVIA